MNLTIRSKIFPDRSTLKPNVKILYGIKNQKKLWDCSVKINIIKLVGEWWRRRYRSGTMCIHVDYKNMAKNNCLISEILHATSAA